MLIDRTELEERILRESKKILFKSNKRMEFCENIYNKHKIPTGKISEIISRGVNIEEVDDSILYCIAEELFPNDIENIFSKKEIKMYSNIKYEAPHLFKFPKELSMVRVNEDQWIGASDSSFLIGLNSYEKIHYNEKTQRVMTKLKRNNTEYYVPTVSKKAVSKIADSMKDGNFIPNTITLNITEGHENDFYFDEEENKVILSEGIEFDITDGYHRFLAMQKNYGSDEDFNYPIEIRIIKFNEAKAQQMIYQEDQKTKMKKVDSESFNTNSPSNMIVERLNGFGSPLKGMLDRNKGIIDYGTISQAIDINYFKLLKKSEIDNAYMSFVSSDLKEKFSLAMESYPELFSEKMSKTITAGMISVFKNESEPNNMIRKIRSLIDSEKDIEEATRNRVSTKQFYEMVSAVTESV